MFEDPLLESALSGGASRTSAAATAPTIQRAISLGPTGITLNDLPWSSGQLYRLG